MNLKDIDRVRELQSLLIEARLRVRGFEAWPTATLPTYAVAGPIGRTRDAVEVMAVSKETAVSAAKREVNKIIGELAQLGVTVDEDAS